ncbi:MAG: hypothetical protein K1V96_04205 [Lachnospiraceae bacterium]
MIEKKLSEKLMDCLKREGIGCKGCVYYMEDTIVLLCRSLLENIYERLRGYEDLEEKCRKETTWNLKMLLEKWKEFSEDTRELYEYRRETIEGNNIISSLKHCLNGDGCENCKYAEANSILSCQGLLETVCNFVVKVFEENQQYRAFGTVEECQKAIKKQKGEKIFGNKYNPIHVGDTVSGLCPICLTEFVYITPRMYKANGFGYCKQCGQKIDWSNL